ncbi:hypothetical protein [Tenacibaculum agarivorans]|uniref:hypothetical protein n=1 Tax=Tenacibaculum agarivorans TaxID=1908389 RepID=UPI00094BB170|nr:hypothetical protein [Tenacibaculum agarivorans]
MKLFIFKTDIDTPAKVDSINSIFNNNNNIIDVSIDLEDIDNVLRIEAEDTVSKTYLTHQVINKGFNCEELAD